MVSVVLGAFMMSWHKVMLNMLPKFSEAKYNLVVWHPAGTSDISDCFEISGILKTVRNF